MTAPTKTCASCGRVIEWRKKWERDWDDVRYCSAACRRRGVTDVDRKLEAAIEKLLTGRTTVISPDDAARAVGDEQTLREPARRAARRLAAAGRVEFILRGRVVDPSTAKGDVGLRRAH